jgi:putative transposase
MESIEHHETYMGKRIRRGVFKSAKGKLIHADLQAAYNIIKKAVPEFTVLITSKGGC